MATKKTESEKKFKHEIPEETREHYKKARAGNARGNQRLVTRRLPRTPPHSPQRDDAGCPQFARCSN